MTSVELGLRLRELACERLPAPGSGGSAIRHRRLFEVSREDVSLAKLAEAHWDAVAILEEAGREAKAGATYAVWASEIPGQALRWQHGRLSGTKRFASGAGIVDRALITVSEPESLLVEVDLSLMAEGLTIDLSGWESPAFAATQTGSVTFHDVPLEAAAVIGDAGWYVRRPGFWHGACGPAACWAGGAAGLLSFALQSRREDPHTLAHLGAMAAEIHGMEAILQTAGEEMDAAPADTAGAHRRAMMVRHLIESACARVLTHFGRAYGPHPLAMEALIARRYAEVELYIRQSHAERDLEQLGRALRS